MLNSYSFLLMSFGYIKACKFSYFLSMNLAVSVVGITNK